MPCCGAGGHFDRRRSAEYRLMGAVQKSLAFQLKSETRRQVGFGTPSQKVPKPLVDASPPGTPDITTR
jgi:hypothetical protein